MSSKQSRSEASLEYLYARLDTVRMSAHERLRAKAHLAQAEAVADAIFGLIAFTKRLLTAPFARPLRRPTTSAG